MTNPKPKEEEESESSPDVFTFDPQVKAADIHDIFGWNRKDPFSTFDYWSDICKECKVAGDIDEEKRVNEESFMFYITLGLYDVNFFFLLIENRIHQR